jgi:glucoamylase
MLRPALAGADPSAVAPYMLSLMLRNISTPGFLIADHNQSAPPPAAGAFSLPGCILASPSWDVGSNFYPGNVATIAEDYVFNWTRDAAITVSTVLDQAPDLVPTEAATGILAGYVNFANACQTSGGDIGQAKYTPEGQQTFAADESDGPALRVLTVLQGFALLDGPTQDLARNVIAADLGYLLNNNRSQAPTVTHWEDTFGQSIFARAVQLRCLNQVVEVGPGLGVSVPAAAPGAAAWLADQLPTHWSGAPNNYYQSVLGAERLSGDPAASYDPSIDPIMACLYGDGIPSTDAKLLSTTAQVRAQWTTGGAPYPINAADLQRGIGPMMGRYLGDEYDGLSLTSDTGHPWAVCTCNFAQLYYELASAIAGGAPVPVDPLADTFLAQVGVSATVASDQVVAALRSAGDSMLNAIIYHSNNLELSEQFDQSTGYEKSVSNLTWSYAAFLSAVGAR